MNFKEERSRRKRNLRKRIATAAASLFVVAWAVVFGQTYVDANLGGDGGESESDEGSPSIVIGGDEGFGFGPIVIGGSDSSGDDEGDSGFSIGSSPSPDPVTSSQS